MTDSFNFKSDEISTVFGVPAQFVKHGPSTLSPLPDFLQCLIAVRAPLHNCDAMQRAISPRAYAYPPHCTPLEPQTRAVASELWALGRSLTKKCTMLGIPDRLRHGIVAYAPMVCEKVIVAVEYSDDLGWRVVGGSTSDPLTGEPRLCLNKRQMEAAVSFFKRHNELLEL